MKQERHRKSILHAAIFASEKHSVPDNRYLTLPEEGLQEEGPVGIAGGFSRLGIMGQPFWDLI